MKTFLTILITAAVAVTASWLFLKPKPAPATNGRTPIYYQSAMHPWIKSDKPGRCTICGMELTPVYAGDKGFDSSSAENLVALTDTQSKILGVATTKASTKPLARTLQVAGMVDDDDSRHRILSAYVPGRIDKLHVNYVGAEVTEGQVLAEIYSPTLLQSEREYRQLSGDLKKATALRLRQMGLTQAQIEGLANQSADSLTTEILAPMSGTVVARDLYEGQYVMEGAKLFEIADFNTMWFKFDAYEQDVPWLRVGQAVQVTLPSQPGKTFEGTIKFIDPNFNEATRSTKVRVELPNPLVNGRREILHRTYADAKVTLETPEVLSVPKSAVMQTGGDALVYVDMGSHSFAQRVVKIGRRGDSELEILSGLKAGDAVVTTGTLLIDGQAELNRSFMGNAAPSFTEPQQTAIREFVEVSAAMANALASDDLAGFHQASEPAMEKTAALAQALAPLTDLNTKLEALNRESHFHGANSLTEARETFYRFAMPAAEVLKQFANQPGAPDFQIWQCPMVDSAIKIPTKEGLWIQKGGTEGRNPYFGAAMLNCGEPLKGGANHDR